MAYGSLTLGRGSFSVDTLDGIEVKVGENFRPIEKVTLPMRYRQADPTDILQAPQYDFETETTFLTWLQTKKKNDAEKETAKQAALTLQQEAAAAVAAAASKQSQEQATASAQPVSAASTHNSVSPVNAGLGQDILMPTQLHNVAPTQTVPPKAKTQTSFDPRDFENNASDPFETTELQTINDMDELRAVLGHSIPQQQQGSSELTNHHQQQQQGTAQNHLTNPQQVQTVSQNNETINDASPSEPEYQNIQKQPDYQNVQRNDEQSVCEDASQQHEYQNVQIDRGTGLVLFKPNKPGSPSLPPRGVDQTTPNGALSPDLLPNGVSEMPTSTDKAGTMNLTFPTRTLLPPITTPSSSRENTNVSIGAGNSSSSTSSTSQPIETPELAERAPPRSRSPPGYYAPGYARPNPAAPMAGAVPLPGLPPDPPPGYPQSLSRFTPLPSSPARSRTLSEEDRNRPDPIYDAMSTEDKNFVMTLMGMGFPKSRTARVVKRIGRDDRLVVESLCAVENLCSESFPEDRAEEALNLMDNDQEKAKNFLKLYKQFEELGFKGDDIKRELIVHNNNQEKVLDSLTAEA